MRLSSFLAAIAITLSASALATASTYYTITDLGTLTTVDYSNGRTLNNNGQVGGYSAGLDHYSRAFYWENGAMTDMGLFGAQASFSWDMNDSGQIAVFTVGPDCAWLWDNGTAIRIPTLPGGTINEARGINNYGQVVGGSGSASGQRGFIWDNGTLTPLGTLGGSHSRAYAINDAGQVTGTSTTASGEWNAFIWDNGTMTDLGTLGCGGSSAVAINEAGHVVGRSWLPGGGFFQGFLYRDGGMIHLGRLGGRYADALGINNLDQVVGYSETSDDTVHAFLWEDGVMTDLNDFLVDGAGWDLTEAADINDVGQIVGCGYINGVEHGFLLTPVPEPAAFGLLSLGALLMLRRRRA